MSLNLRVTKKTLHFTKEKKEVFVAAPNRGNVIDAEKIADLIAKDTGTRPAQVKMVEAVPKCTDPTKRGLHKLVLVYMLQNNDNCIRSSLTRLQAISKYSFCNSKPIKLRLVRIAAMAVVPLPINGSRITSFLYVII